MLRAIVCLVTLGFAAAAQAQVRDTSATRPPAAGTAVIRGRVIEAGANRPLAHALVRLTNSVPGFEKLTATDTGGRFELTELARGTYSIAASKPNYLPQNRGEKRPIGPGVPLEVADGQMVENINFALQRAGAVTGRITDEFGEPLADTQVSLMRWFFTNGERRLQASGGSASTNDLGEFRIFNVRPGQYIVGATLRPNFNPGPNGDTADRSAYTPTYYPGTPNPNEGQRVRVEPGQTVTGMSFALLPVTSARVSGSVVDSQGRPLPNGSVNAMPRTNGFGIGGGGPIRDGKFSLTLTPGDYTLRSTKPGAGGSPVDNETAILDVNVAGTDISDLLLVTMSPSTLRGRVVLEQSAATPPATSTIRVNAMSTSPATPGGTSATPKDDMTFEMKRLQGPVMIRAAGSGDWRLRRVTLRGVDITDTIVQIPPNAAVDGIVVELTTHLAQVAVRPIDENGAPTRDCIVVVFAKDSARWTPQTRYVAGGSPNIDGVFHPHIASGDYLIAAFRDESPSGLWNDPEVLSQLRESAVPISLVDDDDKKIDVKLGPTPVY